MYVHTIVFGLDSFESKLKKSLEKQITIKKSIHVAMWPELHADGTSNCYQEWENV